MDETLMDVAVVDDGAFIALRSDFGGDLLRSADQGYDGRDGCGTATSIAVRR